MVITRPTKSTHVYVQVNVGFGRFSGSREGSEGKTRPRGCFGRFPGGFRGSQVAGRRLRLASNFLTIPAPSPCVFFENWTRSQAMWQSQHLPLSRGSF